MAFKSGIHDIIRTAIGAAVMLAVFFAVLHFRAEHSPAEQLAVKANKVDLVSRMRMALAMGSEAQKSAVLAVTDQDVLSSLQQAILEEPIAGVNYGQESNPRHLGAGKPGK